jgi:hypothetical protein
MRELFTQSEHALNGFILVIVGTEDFPKSLSVWLYAASRGVRLYPAVGKRSFGTD